MNHGPRPHFSEVVQPIDFANVNVRAAKPQDFERCNACRYPFHKLHGRIDMNDFRQHKQTCDRRLD